MRQTYNSYIETPDGTVLPLMISLPNNYSESKTYPLTVFLHGNGEFHTGYPNMLGMYKQGLTKEIKEGKRDDYESIVVAIQGYSKNKQWWVEQIEYIISILAGEIAVKGNHRKDTLGGFTPLAGIKKYNIKKDIDFMVISQGGQGFADWLKRYTKRTVGVVTLVSAYVTLNASDTAFQRVKGGVQVYHNSSDGVVGKWGAIQLAEKAATSGLESRIVVYDSSSHDAWTKAFADKALYDFHKAEVATEPVVEEPAIVVPEEPKVENIPSGILKLNKAMFSTPDKVNIDNIVNSILKGEEYPINWSNQKPFTIVLDLGQECTVSKIRVKDGQGINTDPSVFKMDSGESIGVFYGKQYNIWYDLPTYNFKTRYIRIENIQETKKNLPIGLEIIIK